jgi:hypothetical protein
METIQDRFRWLRMALRGNAMFSGFSGLLFLVAGQPVADVLGFDMPWPIRIVGIGLVVFALWLLVAARRPIVDRREVWTAIWLDVAWVAGSALLLITNPLPLTTQGQWAVGIVADIVGCFALLQWYGLRGQRKLQVAP